MANDAKVIAGRMYTVRPVYDIWGRKAMMPWAGYCDGERVGFYRTKKEWWAAAQVIAQVSTSPQCQASVDAEMRHARDAARVMDRLRWMMAGNNE